MEDLTVVVVAEIHRLEVKLSAVNLQRGRAGAVRDLAVDVEQVEHVLHIHQPLPDFTVGKAEEVQRQIQLDQIGLNGDEIADRHLPGQHLRHRQGEQQHQPAGDDNPLPDVEQRQRQLIVDGCALVAAQRAVEARGFVHFVGEILDRLVVEQRIHSLGRRLRIGLVHHPAVLDAPVGDHDRVDDVTDHGDESDRSVERAEVEQQDQADDDNREGRGDEVEGRHPQHEFDALGAAFDRPRQAAGLAPEVEAQAEFVQVAECLQRHRADAILAHENEQGRADFLTALCQQAGETEGCHQPNQQR